jgi:hypothetical protein
MTLDRIWKLCSTTACSGGVISNLRSPSGGHAGERGGGGVGRHTREEESSKAHGNCVVLSSHWGTLYSGNGCILPIHQDSLGWRPRRGARAAVAGWGQVVRLLPNPNPSPGRLGPRAHGALALCPTRGAPRV